MSKFPIVSSENHRLPRSEGREKAEPRGLLEVVLDVRGRPLRVFVTHLAHDSKPDRLLQIDRVKAALRDVSGPWILMGDLNFRPGSEEYARLFGREEDRSREAGAPGGHLEARRQGRTGRRSASRGRTPAGSITSSSRPIWPTG